MSHALIRKLRWHAFRTPLAAAVKGSKRVLAGRQIERRRAMMAQLPDDAEIRQVVDRFAREGFAPLDELVDRGSLERLLAQTQEALSDGGSSARDHFGAHKDGLWSHAIDAAMIDGRLDAGSAFARAALQPRVLAAVSRSLGMVPRLDYVTVTASKPMLGVPTHSQLWHKDYDDTRVVKVLIYLTDVESEADGPFTFLPAEQSDRVGFSLKSHRTDSALTGKVDFSRQIKMTGPKLSCFMVETSRCLHMGSRVAPGHGRVMFTATFFAPPRIYPEPLRPFFRLTGAETAVERATLMAD